MAGVEVTGGSAGDAPADEEGYRRRIRAWILYDVANSGFATTVLAAVFPVYYASVAGANLPTAATATQYYSLTLSASVLVLAVASPILGTFADVTATKIRLLTMSAAVGIVATASLVAVGEGDWLLASVIFAVGRMGFGSANVFYDALLPHVARPSEVDRVSAHGFAFGYLGGGVLLALNVAMILVLGETLGTRLSLLSVAVWWTAFSIPLVRRVGEPETATGPAPARVAWRITARRLRSTWGDLRVARDLRRYLFAFLVYNDAIGTVIALAAIYASELRIGATDVILALLLVQFSGMAFSLLFGRLPEAGRPRQRTVTAFLVAMILALPVTGLLGRALLPASVSGVAPASYGTVGDAAGGGVVGAATFARAEGRWTTVPLADGVRESLGLADRGDAALTGLRSDGDGALERSFNGRRVEITYTEQPGGGTLVAAIDGRPATRPDGTRARVDTGSGTTRLDATFTAEAETEGVHTLTLTAEDGPVEIAAVEVLPPERQSDLLAVAGLLLATVALAAAFAVTVGRRLLAPVARRLDTRGGIMLALWAYTLIAVWGFVLGSVVEFWCLALMVGVVQGGSQALSRSLYASLVPTAMAGEYFGFFSVLEKFASVVSPLLFALSVALFASSRPAVLALAAFFGVGMWLLRGVDVDRGRRHARDRDAHLRAAGEASGRPGR